MNNDFLQSIKKHTDTLTEQTKTKPQETLEYNLNNQMQTFSFSPPKNLIEAGKWFSAVICFEANNFVFSLAFENNSFSITTASTWIPEVSEEIVEKISN